MIEMPNTTVKTLLENRIEFKFYAAEKHLLLLSDLQAKGQTPNTREGRLNWELLTKPPDNCSICGRIND